MPIKTFRGLIADGAQDTIVLHTNNGSTGYRITKFQIIPNKPTTAPNECVIQIWKVSQTGTSSEIDFSNQTLLGVGLFSNQTDTFWYEGSLFDKGIFNQDIYITHKNETGPEACNYYLELEQIPLDLNQNTVATLKDIRNLA